MLDIKKMLFKTMNNYDFHFFFYVHLRTDSVARTFVFFSLLLSGACSMKRNEQTNESSIKPHDNAQSLFNKHVSENKAIHCFYSANTRAFDSTFLKKLHCALKIPSVFGVLPQNIFGMHCSSLAKQNIFTEMPIIFEKKII